MTTMSSSHLSASPRLNPLRSPAAVSSAIRTTFADSLRSRGQQSADCNPEKPGILQRLQEALRPTAERQRDWPDRDNDSKTESQEEVFGAWQPISKQTIGLYKNLHALRQERFARILVVLQWLFYFLLFASCVAILILLCLPTRLNHHSALYGRLSASSPLYRSTQRLTRGVIPVRLHSHNDYIRENPLFDALSFGATSIEVDVFLRNGQVLVGHEEDSLDPARSLSSLYLEPLQALLNKQNDALTVEGEQPAGLFDLDPNQSVQLLLDCKEKDTQILAAVALVMDELRSAGYLSQRNANNTAIEPSAITVIASGASTLEQVKSLPVRDIFWDASLTNLTGVDPIWSPMASADLDKFDFNSLMPSREEPLEAMRGAVRQAHALGIATRFWGTPKWPERLRDNALQAAIDVGADWLNVDDLASGAQF